MKTYLKNVRVGLFFFAVATTVAGFNPTFAAEATYFRVWQGFKLTKYNTNDDFNTALAPFLRETVVHYGSFAEKPLVNYIVIIPPKEKPDYLPDEFALIALTDRETYDKIRATPEGQWYKNRHADFFDLTRSKSADPNPIVNYSVNPPTALQNNYAYDMIGEPVDWATGYNAVFIGTRKDGLDATQYLDHLKHHIELAKSVMVPKGLRGYILIANEKYEIAYLNWDSKTHHDQAGASPEGAGVFEDAKSFMDIKLYTQAIPFVAGNPIKAGEAYSTLQQ